MPRLAIFLDDGGVMNDNHRRAAQWRRMIGELLAPILGGAPEAWAEANRILTDGLFEPRAWQARLQAAPDYAGFYRTYLLDWIVGMCRLVGIPAPPEEESFELARQAETCIPRRVDAAFPGAVDAILQLHARGYALHTASGEPSVELDGYLEAMGVRACFGRLYGPDLIDTFKTGPEYYERILDDAGVAPADALIVDDSAYAAEWAESAGARAVLVGESPNAGTALHIRSLAELPEVVDRFE